jgi:hypothetical protein
MLLGWASLPAEAAEPIEARIAIERPDALAGRPLHGNLPLVHASIEGKDGLFLLDTGSSDIVLSTAFAASLPIGPGSAIAGKDSGGHAVAGQRTGPVRLSFDRGRVVRAVATAAIMPLSPLDALGLAGVISPQMLADNGCVMIDFPADRVTFGQAGAPVCARGGLSGVLGKDRRPYITVGNGGADSRPFLLDSGASRTRLPPSFAAGSSGTENTTSQGVAGVAANIVVTGPVRLRIGQQDVVVEAPGLTKPGAPPALGFDVLRRSRLTLHASGETNIRFQN